MGIIKAVTQAVGGAFADQWLEVIEADNFLLHFNPLLLRVLVCLRAAVSSAFSLKASCFCAAVSMYTSFHFCF